MNDLFTPDFSEWYARYPRKQGRKAAEKAWGKLNLSEKLAAWDDDLQRRFQFTDRQFIPHPATYLNGARWEDDMPEANVETRARSLREDLTDTSWV